MKRWAIILLLLVFCLAVAVESMAIPVGLQRRNAGHSNRRTSWGGGDLYCPFADSVISRGGFVRDRAKTYPSAL